jgi:hypothetical protein
MAMMEKNAAGMGTVVAGCKDEDMETGQRIMWDNKSWGHQSRIGSGATKGGGGR